MPRRTINTIKGLKQWLAPSSCKPLLFYLCIKVVFILILTKYFWVTDLYVVWHWDQVYRVEILGRVEAWLGLLS